MLPSLHAIALRGLAKRLIGLDQCHELPAQPARCTPPSTETWLSSGGSPITSKRPPLQAGIDQCAVACPSSSIWLVSLSSEDDDISGVIITTHGTIVWPHSYVWYIQPKRTIR